MDGQQEINNTKRQPVRGLQIPAAPRIIRTHPRSAALRRDMALRDAQREAHAAQTSGMTQDTVMADVVDPWDLVENETPVYLRREKEQEPASTTARVNVANTTQRDPFAIVAPSRPRDIVTEAGHRVRVYEHNSTRRVTFAPGVAPPRPARAPGTPMFEVERRPTPCPPPRPARDPGTPMYEVQRRPTPFPDLLALDVDQVRRHKDAEYLQHLDAQMQHVSQQRHEGQQAQTGEVQYHRGPLRAHPTGRPNGGIRIHTGPLPKHPDGRFKHPPLGWRPPPEIDERQMFIDEYGAVPWEDQTPYILAAADRRRGINNPLRPTKPTWEEEDDDDDDFRPTGKYKHVRVPEWLEEEDGDDEASVKQNRPEDYERPQGRCGHRGPDPVHHDDPHDAPVKVHEEPARPAISLQAGLNQSPLYGKLVIDNNRRSFHYHRTTRFNAWLLTAVNNRTPPNDYFHEWLRATETQDVQRKAVPMKKPDVDPPKANKVAAAELIDVSTPKSSPIAQTAGSKNGKRGSDSPEDGRASKRVRLASTFRRKLSLQSNHTNNITSYSSGETNTSVANRRFSGLDIFNVPGLSSLRGLGSLGSLSRATSVGPKRVRIAIIGDSLTGKTTLLNRFYTGTYQPAEKSAHYRNNDFNMVIDGHPIILEAWDIPGDLPADETHPLNRSFFDAALICVAVDNCKTVDRAPYWMNVLQSFAIFS
ncbi:hypothetical protein BR93DRAFT_968582 [Coniochaeta sp. PMI_546]|nr:hypothetical protein BR93DRAFT_968582 [Coniochaeta sp. PMI_546]